MASEDECVVCFNDTSSRVAPCDHPLCTDCASKWFTKFAVRPSCPLCRTLCLLPIQDEHRSSVRVDFTATHQHVGVTLSNTEGGVRVKKVMPPHRAAKCGIRVGDVITHLNCIPVRDHETAAQLTNIATARQMDLYYRVRRPIWVKIARRVTTVAIVR